MYHLKTFIRESRDWGIRTAWFNLRFRVGYAIGGFTSARRSG